MFDTEKFIMGIQNRQGIWNTSSPEYADRANRRKAWEEVAALMYDGFGKISVKRKNELVLELQKKWKHLRDYFVREKNKELQMGTVLPRKRRAPFLDLLNDFMHVSKTVIPSNRPPVQQQSQTSPPNSREEEPDDTNSKHNAVGVHKDNKRPKLNHDTSLPLSTNEQTQSNLDPNMVFLLSILPEMQTMTDRQVFDFKLEVMKVIKTIKYDDPNYYHSPVGPSTSFHKPYYIFGGQNYGVDHESNNSFVSEHSDQDKSFVQPEICIIEREENNEDEEKIL